MPKQEEPEIPPMPEGPEPPITNEPPMEPQDAPEPPSDDMPDDEGSKVENKEIDDIFGKLDTEKQAAVIKYAKSMINDEGSGEPPTDELNDMPMEGTDKIGEIITEIINNVLNDEDSDDEDELERKDDKIRNKKVTKDNPFISKR